MAGKLATVLYQCLKTSTLYDEQKHLRQMGFVPEELDVVKSTAVEMPDDLTETGRIEDTLTSSL